MSKRDPTNPFQDRSEIQHMSEKQDRISLITRNICLRQADMLETALRNLMVAYERKVRSDCKTADDIAKQPWRCTEFIEAEQAIAVMDAEP